MKVRIGQTSTGSYIAYRILSDSSCLVCEGSSIEDAKMDFLKALEKVRHIWKGPREELEELLELAPFVYDAEFNGQAEQLRMQLAIMENLRYLKWRNDLQSKIRVYESRFFTPWVPYFPVVLRCAPKHIKFRFRKRKKRIIKKWYHRYERENFAGIKSLRSRCLYPNKKKREKSMSKVMVEAYRKSHAQK